MALVYILLTITYLMKRLTHFFFIDDILFLFARYPSKEFISRYYSYFVPLLLQFEIDHRKIIVSERIYFEFSKFRLATFFCTRSNFDEEKFISREM